MTILLTSHIIGTVLLRSNNKLDELAQHKYVTGGYQAAFNKIDSMDADLVKAYLKDLIKNNMAVGVEIINNKK